MVLQRRFVLKHGYNGAPTLSNFEYQEEEIDDSIDEGEYFYEALYISVDPYLRAHPHLSTEDRHEEIVSSLQLSRITKSNNSKYPVGQLVLQHTGWCNVGKHDGKYVFTGPLPYDETTAPLCISTLGLTGLTAYFGLFDICQSKEGETVMVTTGAGAVGTVVGQLAKIKGCRVIGSCGSDEKVALMKSIGYDDAFNYKTCTDWKSTIKQMAPNGIDCFFDNVGGLMARRVIKNMNRLGRVAGCGCISQYNLTEEENLPPILPDIVSKELTIKGFMVTSYKPRFTEAIVEMTEWIKLGKIKPIQHVVKGFENIPQTFLDLFQGKNIGKSIIKI